MLSRRRFVAFLAAVPPAKACAAYAQTAPAAAEPVKVVATFSILADLVRQVGGERVSLTTLVGPDGDAHVYSPSPADARAVAAARLVVANGLGFEGWIERLVRSSGGKPALVRASRGVDAVRAEGGGRPHGHAHDGDADPHAWHAVPNVKLYVANVRDALTEADPAGRGAYEANAAAFLARLDALDGEIRAAVARVPPEKRRVVTSHDAFAYFERAYGLDFVALQGVSTEAEASARDVARVVGQVRREKVRAVFLENVGGARLMEQVARETGARVGGRLYSDALSGPDGPAGTYIDMMRHNVRMLTEALVG